MPKSFDRLKQVLEEADIDHDLKLYPETGRGFLNDHVPTELPIWVRAVAKLTAAEHHEPSARDAGRRSSPSSALTSLTTNQPDNLLRPRPSEG